MRQAQHPLTDWHIRPNVIDQMRRPLRHAPATTARAEPAALAREGDQSIEPAGGAPKAREAAGEAAAPQEVSKLLFNKLRQPPAIPQRGGLGAEGLEMLSDDLVEDRSSGIAWLIGGRWLRHAPWGGARLDDVKQEFDRRVERGEFIAVEREPGTPGRSFTTPAMLELEQQTIIGCAPARGNTPN
jgi:hypothetical protein